MEITLVRSSKQRKNPRLVIFNFEGRSGSAQFFRALFPKDAVPEKLTLTGTFAEPKAKETSEERKARLAAITPAEKLARMEKRLAAMRAKLAKEQAAPAPPAPAPQAAPPATTKADVKNTRSAKARR